MRTSIRHLSRPRRGLPLPPVAYSLLDDLSATSHWRAVASTVGAAYAPIKSTLRSAFTRQRRSLPLDEESPPESESTPEHEGEHVGSGAGSGD